MQKEIEKREKKTKKLGCGLPYAWAGLGWAGAVACVSLNSSWTKTTTSKSERREYILFVQAAMIQRNRLLHRLIAFICAVFRAVVFKSSSWPCKGDIWKPSQWGTARSIYCCCVSVINMFSEFLAACLLQKPECAAAVRLPCVSTTTETYYAHVKHTHLLWFPSRMQRNYWFIDWSRSTRLRRGWLHFSPFSGKLFL